jgi:bacillithiol biosynthesis cysteine-adding enzyme BshC
MDQTVNYLPYESTGYFTKIVSDYLSHSPLLKPFYKHSPDIDGLKNAIVARQSFQTPRKLLAEVLEKQYEGLAVADAVGKNIALLEKENTFTVTTAHQPNIFTGPLYFIYKILHAIKLADELKQEMPTYDFVPVYYMGSEDADLDELGFVNVGGQKLVWETRQTGAVGRMKVDKALLKLVDAIYGQAGVWQYGKELTDLLKQCYTEGKLIQQATLELVNALFGNYGLLVLIPDNAKLKTAFHAVVEKEIKEGFSHTIVADTIDKLGQHYKVQAAGREINLFYLVGDKRERIELTGAKYEVKSLNLVFSEEEIISELTNHPERFSANVILRGAFQETVLPNIAFIGGGGELAYWLELKNVFEAVAIPYPVLMLRNSFLLIKKAQAEKWEQLGFDEADLFLPETELVNRLVKRETENQLTLSKEIQEATAYYDRLKKIAAPVDQTLSEHITALEKKALKKIEALEKKILRAEKLKYAVQQKQIAVIKQDLFPNNSLQERQDNFSLYYAIYGKDWLQMLYAACTGLNKGFGMITV